MTKVLVLVLVCNDKSRERIRLYEVHHHVSKEQTRVLLERFQRDIVVPRKLILADGRVVVEIKRAYYHIIGEEYIEV